MKKGEISRDRKRKKVTSKGGENLFKNLSFFEKRVQPYREGIATKEKGPSRKKERVLFWEDTAVGDRVSRGEVPRAGRRDFVGGGRVLPFAEKGTLNQTGPKQKGVSGLLKKDPEKRKKGGAGELLL